MGCCWVSVRWARGGDTARQGDSFAELEEGLQWVGSNLSREVSKLKGHLARGLQLQ